VAGTERARDVKPPAAKAPAAVAKPPAGGAAASRLPSPAVAASILAGAERTPRVQATPARKKPPTAPIAIASERSPARVHVEPPAARPAAMPAVPVVKARPAMPALTIVPRPAAATPSRATPAATPAAAAMAAVTAPTAGGRAPAGTAAPETAAAPASPAAPASTEGSATPSASSEAESATAAGPGGTDTKTAEGKEPTGEKGAQKAAPGEAAAPDAAAEGGEGGPAPVAVKLHMPEPPTGPSPATTKRIQGVKSRAGGAAAAHAALPPGSSQVGDARQAVTEPDAEANAKAQAALIAALDEKPAPSPEIVKLCERIREVIRKKRPPDEDALMEAKPEGEALNAGNQLNSTVEGETKKVEGNYASMNQPPAGAAPQKGQELPPQPAAAGTPGVNATAATPDAVPAASVSLDKDAEESKKKMQDAGMDTPAAQLVQSGPVAEARGAQGELDQAAKEDPAKVLAGQKQTLAKAEEDMAALQQQALAALTTSRAGTVKGATSQQHGMVGSEESMRTKASSEAKAIFDTTQKQVSDLLKPLSANALAEWEAAKDVLVSQFKADLAPVQKRIDERHAGVGGWFTGLWDAVAGLPDWAEEGYTRAEKNFGDGVCAKITEVSVKVNSVIATCEALIKNARQAIAKIFSELPASLQAWAAQEQGKFDGQLDQLHNQAVAARDSFTKDLVERSSGAVDEVRAEIADLRKKAGGLVGRIISAVNRFLDDPVKFIIEGILELLGIPPAAFWAVVAKIKKVVKEIADDPMKFANNLLKGLAMGFGQFFDNIGTHLIKGFLSWLLGGLVDAGVQLPKDFSLKSIITFFLQLMGITWPRIRKVLVKQIGEKNVALIEKVYSLISLLIEKGPEGIFEMIKDKLDPQSIVDQVIQMAVEFMVSAILKAAAARIIMLFNPAGAILQALEAIYRVLKWVFQNAARIFTLVETVVNGIADILAGSLGGFANAVEKGLAMLIAPVISFIADYLNFGDLPQTIAEKVKTFQAWIFGFVEKAIIWFIEKGKALLAAIGIGGKDKDKDKDKGKDGEAAIVGKEIDFETEEESHRLWIEVSGENATVMVASDKEPLERFLNSKRVKEAVKKDKTGELGGLVSQALGMMRETDVDADKVVKLLAKATKEPDEKAAPPAEASSANKEVETEEQKLVGYLIKIFQLIGGKGLKIQDVIGLPIDPLPEEAPEGYDFWMPGTRTRYRELKRASGFASKGSQYPPVSVDESGVIERGAGPWRYDLNLIARYDQAVTTAEGRAGTLQGSPEMNANILKSQWTLDDARAQPRLFGLREHLEAVIDAVQRGELVVGIEVTMPSGGRADYIVRDGQTEQLVEVKAWRTLDLSAQSDAVQKFLTQMRRYIDEAQARIKAAPAGAVHFYEVVLEFRTPPEEIDRVRTLVRGVIRQAQRRKPPVEVIVKGIDL
jgi:hypothetical protein